MGVYIPEEIIEDVRRSLDLVAVISEYIDLKRAGRNYVGLCPFHQEKTPSFMVSPEKQIYHCFGCGQGGNVFSYIMENEQIPFPEAVKMLAKKAGIKIPEKELSPAQKENASIKDELYHAMSLATKLYNYILLNRPAGKGALAYLEKRGVNKDYIEKFLIGFAPESWNTLFKFTQKRGISPEILTKVGLVTPQKSGSSFFDRFRNRIIFPIQDPAGKIIGLGGRILGKGEPKYLNSPQTPLFDKSKQLYGLNHARKAIRDKGYSLVFEGYMDVITAHQRGILNAVASLGTSLTPQQARLLRSQAEEAVIAYDADTAGQGATWRGLEVLKNAGCMVRIAELPTNMDPDDFIKEKGAEKFNQEIISTALPMVDYKIKKIKERYDIKDTGERVKYSREVVNVLADIKEVLERESYIKKIEEELSLPGDSLRHAIKKVIKNNKSFNNNITKKGKNNTIGIKINSILPSEAAEKILIGLILVDPRMIHEVESKLTPEDFSGEVYAEIYTKVLDFNRNNKKIDLATLMDSYQNSEIKTVLANLGLSHEIEKSLHKKMIEDCIRKIKLIKITKERKNIEEKLQEMERKKEKEGITKLLQEWTRLKKEEELFCFTERRD